MTACPNSLPKLGEPFWDDSLCSYVGFDADGFAFYGPTLDAVRRQYAEAMHHLVRSTHDSGFSLSELRADRRQTYDWQQEHIDGVPC